MSQVHVIGVEGENFLLIEAAFQDDRHINFFEFPKGSTLGRQPEASDQLLSNGTGPLCILSSRQVYESGPHNSNGVDALMFKESPVFNRKHGITQDLGDILIIDEPPFFPSLVKQISNELGFYFVRV